MSYLLLPVPKKSLKKFLIDIRSAIFLSKARRDFYICAILLDLILMTVVLVKGIEPAKELVSPLIAPLQPLHPITQNKGGFEVFGFAPHWTMDKMRNIDFNVLTTLAYFSIPVNPDGTLDKQDRGYEVFKSREATDLFKKAHSHGTRVVLTLTQMENYKILALLDDPSSQEIAINEAVEEVKNRGIDGINIDFEYGGDPGDEYRDKFSQFVGKMTSAMHSAQPSSKVTVSVYAASVKEPKIYDIPTLSTLADILFMMAYDFAVAGSDNAIPTAPLYGYKEGKYWYDVSTAVNDFLSKIPANKIILGVPWYGYNYLVYEPAVKAETRPIYSWRGKPKAQTYAAVIDNINPSMEGIGGYLTGWDDIGKVGWRAYYVNETDTWRMIFLEDIRSLSEKYAFVKAKKLAGIGMWALGFEEDKAELWQQLVSEFGLKTLADKSLQEKAINE